MSDGDDRKAEPAPEATNPAEEASADIDSGTGVGDRPSDGHDPRDESTQIATEERRRQAGFVSALIAAIGAWVALSVLIFDVGGASLWNNVLVGAFVFLAAGYNAVRLRRDTPTSLGVASLVTMLGLWLILSAALFGMLGTLFWSTLGSGFLIAGLAGYNAYESHEIRAVATGDVST